MKKTAVMVRDLLLAVFANPGVFAVAAYVVSGMFTTPHLSAYRGTLELGVLVPWGLALAMLRLYHAKERSAATRFDVMALFMLFGWLVVPFGIRFGLNSSSINTWQNFAIIFFGIFAMIAEMDETSIARTMDAAAVFSGVVSFMFAGALLWCAVTVTNIRTPYAEFGFGVYQYKQLCADQHYNATGMLAMCGTFMCLMGMQRGKCKLVRALYLIPAVMSSLVVILSQSRTARYSLLAGLAVGAYGAVAAGKWNKRLLIRQAASVLAGVVVLVGGYVFSAKITDVSVAYFEKAQARDEAVLPDVSSETQEVSAEIQEVSAETQAGGDTQQDLIVEQKVRGMGEGSFTGRTGVWGNIFRMWKAAPKYFLIGNGIGRTSREILLAGTVLENWGANMAHNAYIQFTMDNGLIGIVLLGVFFALLLPSAIRTLLAVSGKATAGSHAMCMLAVGCLATGLMENEPLNAMRPCNVMLFFALAVIAYAGTKAKR